MSTTTQQIVMEAIEKGVTDGGATLVVNARFANEGSLMAVKPGDLTSAAVVRYSFSGDRVKLAALRENKDQPIPDLPGKLRYRLGAENNDNANLSALVAAAVAYLLAGRS